MHLTGIGKQADTSGVFTGEDVFILCIRGFFIPFISRLVDGFCVTKTVHEEYNIHLFQFFLLVDRFLTVLDDGLTGMAVFLFESIQFIHNDLRHGISAIQYVFIAVNICHGLFVLVDQGFQLQTDQLIQTHL